MAKFNQKTILQPLAAFSMAILLGMYVNHAINDSRRESKRRQQKNREVIITSSILKKEKNERRKAGNKDWN